MLGDGVFTSTLRVPGPPNVGTVRYYQCAVEPGGHQNNFPIHVLRGMLLYIYHYKA